MIALDSSAILVFSDGEKPSIVSVGKLLSDKYSADPGVDASVATSLSVSTSATDLFALCWPKVPLLV